MRKYNIPLKEIKEVKQEIVECSSGSGEEVKEYYYYTFSGDFRGVMDILLQCSAEMIVKINNKIEIVHFSYCYFNPNIYFGIDMARFFRIPLTTIYVDGELIKGDMIDLINSTGTSHSLHRVEKELFDKACEDITLDV